MKARQHDILCIAKQHQSSSKSFRVLSRTSGESKEGKRCHTEATTAIQKQLEDNETKRCSVVPARGLESFVLKIVFLFCSFGTAEGVLLFVLCTFVLLVCLGTRTMIFQGTSSVTEFQGCIDVG